MPDMIDNIRHRVCQRYGSTSRAPAGDGFATAARSAGNGRDLHTEIRFKDGQFRLGKAGEPIEPDEKFIAQSTEQYWLRLERGRPARRVPFVDDTQRSELGDNDQSRWARFPDGSPDDPWKLVTELSLRRLSDGAQLVFVTMRRSGKTAVSQLAKAILKLRQTKGAEVKAVIQLATRSWTAPTDDEVLFPAFSIVGCVGADEPESAMRRVDFDDEINF